MDRQKRLRASQIAVLEDVALISGRRSAVTVTTIWPWHGAAGETGEAPTAMLSGAGTSKN
jgi:hypothetical protein